MNDQAFGARTKVSSNTYACGSNQNSGNMMTDTPTTRVLQQPGGRSNFSLAWDAEAPKVGTGGTNRNWRGGYGGGGGGYDPGGGRESDYTDYGGPPQARPMSSNAFAGGCNQNSGPPQARPMSSNAFACGCNQNSGNVMTDYPSTRVAQAPGGRSSLSLGWDTEPRTASTGSTPLGGMGRFAQQPSPQPPWSPVDGGGGSMLADDFGPGGSGRQHYDGYYQDEPPEETPVGPVGQLGNRRGVAGSPPGASYGPPFGVDVAQGQRPRESSNSFADGSKQNCGNYLTGVPTTRVLQSPGGASNFALGWEGGSGNAPAAAAVPRGGGCSMVAAGQRPATCQGGRGGLQRDQAFGQRQRVSGNSFANGADQNCGNYLTDTPSTRVAQNPGGNSTFRLG